MMIRPYLLLGALVFAAAGTLPATAADNDVAVKNALSAAPEAVAKDATVMIGDGKGGMTTVKKGTNGFTCMPDDPTTPTNDPMCLDGNSMLWVQAYMTHGTPPEGKVGIAYMLQGDSVASNIDPYATKPANGKWLTDGPHMMIFNTAALLDAYPHNVTETPDTTQPYVMFAGFALRPPDGASDAVALAPAGPAIVPGPHIGNTQSWRP